MDAILKRHSTVPNYPPPDFCLPSADMCDWKALNAELREFRVSAESLGRFRQLLEVYSGTKRYHAAAA
jgi:hypothetical protein